MNPFPIVLALWRRTRVTSALFLLLIAISIALGVAIIAQERGLRTGSARASDPFDLIVAAPGSRTEILFNVVYLRPSAVELIPADKLVDILADPIPTFAAPIAFGDNAEGFPIVGTTTNMLRHLAGDTAISGAMWVQEEEAIIGANLPFEIGEVIHSAHGDGDIGGNAEEVHYDDDVDSHGGLRIVGRMPKTGTAWDSAVLVPIEYSWSTHAMLAGDPGVPGVLEPGDALGPVPAVVLETQKLADAYGLRTLWQTESTTAFFPAEALSEIYAYMGDVRRIMSALTMATQGLVIAAILSGVVALMQLYSARLALLRALGATRGYVFAVMWVYVMGLIMGGAALGLAGGTLTARAITALFASETGLILTTWLGWEELRLVALVVALGAVLAVLPALLLFRKPAVHYLR
jgi:putative ABC transport system permease protein